LTKLSKIAQKLQEDLNFWEARLELTKRRLAIGGENGINAEGFKNTITLATKKIEEIKAQINRSKEHA
jgi:hypothetical protein